MEGTGNGERGTMGNVGTGNLGDVGTCGEREREREREQARTGRPETRVLWCVCVWAHLRSLGCVPSRDLSRRHLCLLSFIGVLP